MKKIITFVGIAILFALLSAPSFVRAEIYQVGTAIVTKNGVTFKADIFCDEYPESLNTTYISSKYWINSQGRYSLTWSYNGQTSICFVHEVNYMFIPTLDENIVIQRGPASDPTLYKTYAYNNEQDYFENIPDEFRPSVDEQRWNAFYELYKRIFGYYPVEGSFIDWLRDWALGDDVSQDIVFPTNTPTLTPTPTPTPIPVQTIFVPSGNGDYTIIYQYPQSDGTITQSPYNPNVDVNVYVDCDCNGGGQNYNPQDPMYYPFDGITWASIDGEFTDSPAMTAGNSLDMIKAETETYDEPIKVVSNSFNVLPVKWLGLVGLLGACLIVAGLIRTFLGG